MPMLSYLDMHCHLPSFNEPAALAQAAEGLDLGFLSVAMQPEEYLRFLPVFVEMPNVWMATGLHPWLSGDENFFPVWTKQVADQLAHERLVGEIGLDFLPKHCPQDSWEVQSRAFTHICKAAAHTSSPEHPHLLSIHAVSSANEVLVILESSGATERCACIMHWFSGSNEELWHAIHDGCYFSVNARMVKTKRSREYLKLIPADKLLLETDYPRPNYTASPQAWAEEIVEQLRVTSSAIAQIRGDSEEHIRELTCENALALLNA